MIIALLLITGLLECEAMYSELNKVCNELEKKYISEIRILDNKNLTSAEKDFISSNWNAFLIALICDQSVKEEIAWRLPYRLSERLGYFDFKKILSENNIETLESTIKKKPALHRFPKKVAEYIYSAICDVVKIYEGDVSLIWKEDNDAGHVIEKFKKFKGISHKKAALGVLLLMREFNLKFSNLEQVGIAADVHVTRVFSRMGLIEKEMPELVIEKAKKINPKFPGSLSSAFWIIGRKYCHPAEPSCISCPFFKFCKPNYSASTDIEDIIVRPSKKLRTSQKK